MTMCNVIPLADCVFLDNADIFFVEEGSHFQIDDSGWYIWLKSGEEYEDSPNGPYPTFGEAFYLTQC
jgi:hypothetical protein